MIKSKGFTMIEMLFVLAVIIMGSYIILPIRQQQLTLSSIIENRILINIEKARLDAILTHQSKTLLFDDDCIYINNECIFQNQNVNFNNNQITYNSQGHIQQAKTINFCINQREYRLIFNLGQGMYHLEKK